MISNIDFTFYGRTQFVWFKARLFFCFTPGGKFMSPVIVRNTFKYNIYIYKHELIIY